MERYDEISSVCDEKLEEGWKTGRALECELDSTQHVATLTVSGVTYLHGDHLGSTNVTSGLFSSE